jgi:hypothetical protein
MLASQGSAPYSSRCPSPASPYTDVTACSGVAGSSRTSASLSPLGYSNRSLPLTYPAIIASVSPDRPPGAARSRNDETARTRSHPLHGEIPPNGSLIRHLDAAARLRVTT